VGGQLEAYSGNPSGEMDLGNVEMANWECGLGNVI